MTKVIGIDLGTTNSCVSVLEGGIPVVISSSEGGRTTPSIVAFTKSGEQLIGQLAKRQGVTNAENTIYSIKRFIGRRWEETTDERTRVAYHCVQGRDNTVDIQIHGRNYTPQEISATILQKLKKDAENFLGHSVEQAVITVPAYFTDAQRQATKDAGTIAGLEVLRIVNEPTAAALAYGLDKANTEQKIMVVDLGGGTFDVSILQLGNDVYEVKATSGNNHLGGDDFDDKIVQWLADRFHTTERIDLFKDKMALQRLREAAEKAKVELSTMTTTTINLPFIASDSTGPKHLEITLSRIKFEEMTAPLIQSTLEPIASALKDAGMGIDNIDRIILIGGSTRIPAVQNAIKEFFKGKTLDRSVNPDEAVAMGAAVQAGVVNGEVKDVLLLDVTPLSLGIETLGEVSTKIIERNTTIPTSKGQEFSTAHDGQSSVEIHVLQGERTMAKDNKSLGRFLLTGIPPASRGVPKIQVVFDIDVNGILQVSAHDLGTGREQTVSITNTGGLQDIDIERMRKEAETFAQDDTRRLQLVEVKNQAEALFHTYNIALRDHGYLIDDSFRERAENTANQLKTLLLDTSPSLETLQQAIGQLQQKIFDMGTTVYQKGVIPHHTSLSNSSAGATKYTPLSQASAPATPPPPPRKPILSTLTLNYEDETSDTEYEPIE